MERENNSKSTGRLDQFIKGHNRVGLLLQNANNSRSFYVSRCRSLNSSSTMELRRQISGLTTDYDPNSFNSLETGDIKDCFPSQQLNDINVRNTMRDSPKEHGKDKRQANPIDKDENAISVETNSLTSDSWMDEEKSVSSQVEQTELGNSSSRDHRQGGVPDRRGFPPDCYSFGSFAGNSYATREHGSDEFRNGRAFPPDSYSFLSLHGPIESPLFFAFGMMGFLFQIAFLLLTVLSVLYEKWNTDGDGDNPGTDLIAAFVAANTTPLVRATQILAILSYIVFTESSLMDVIIAVETFPSRWDVTNRNMVFSCFLRFSQGVMAMIAALLLIITAESVIDIVLNFTAVNFISRLDNVAFNLAMWGKYGPKLQEEVRRIIKLPLPSCMSQGKKHTRFQCTLITSGLIFLAIMTSIIYAQESEDIWFTKVFRVQFHDPDLQQYSGCFSLIDTTPGSKRGIYEGPGGVKIAHCMDTRKWKFFIVGTDPCVHDALELAHSDNSYSFDVSSAFQSGWHSAAGRPLDLCFFTFDRDFEDMCPLVGNGKCDPDLNSFEYGFDAGDCCSASRIGPRCGEGAMAKGFGMVDLAAAGYGFPQCIDPRMKPITILLGNFTKRKEATNSVEIPFPESIGRSNLTLDAKCDEKKVLSIEINEGMANSHETIMVTDGARCTVEVNNPDHETTVDLTIFQGYGADNDPKILQINSGVDEVSSFSAIPTCMFEQLSIHDNTNTTNFYSGSSQVLEAIEWMIEDSTVYSECHTPNFVERFALSVLNYAAPTKSSDNGLWIDKNAPWEWDEVEYINGSLSALDLSEASLEGTISTYIGLLTSLSRISMSDNGLTGKLPSEIGLISSLESLEMGNNALSGSLPSEIGKLTLLTRLSLGNNSFTGTIPIELIKLKNLPCIEIDNLSLEGSLPPGLAIC